LVSRPVGLTVVGSEYDRAKSGASTFGRAGLTRIVDAATRGEFDVLVSEHPDRISRDMADLAGIHKTLEFRGIEMNCVNTGRMDSLQIGMHGVVGQMQREEGAKKVRRGLAGVVRDGRSAGGRAYGYRPVLGKPGKLEIVQTEADIIRRIFETYAVGLSPRTIATTVCTKNLKSDHSGDEVRPGWRLNERHRCAAPSERPVHPYSKTDVFGNGCNTQRRISGPDANALHHG
jgi:site-specific DNA recombinase